MLANIQGCTLSVIAAEARVRERPRKEHEANNSLIRRACAVLERDSRKSQFVHLDVESSRGVASFPAGRGLMPQRERHSRKDKKYPTVHPGESPNRPLSLDTG